MHRQQAGSLAAPSPLAGSRLGRSGVASGTARRPSAPGPSHTHTAGAAGMAAAGILPPGAPSTARRTGSPPRRVISAEDERDEYITNLKGQIYLLTIENEMMKQSQVKVDAKENTSQAHVYASAISKQEAEVERQAAEAAKPPDELADLEAHMRNKYAEIERKYQQDVADAKRAAEALSTQCAAQSSLVAALKQELSGVNELLAQQKALMAQTEAALTADIQRTRADITSLQDQLAAAQAQVAEGQRAVELRDISLADSQSALASAVASRDGANEARLRSLDSYARVFTAMRVLLKNWRHERLQRLTADAAVQSAKTAQDMAEKRAQMAEADVALAQAAQAEAVAARNDALAQEQWLRSRCEVAELAVQRAQADAEARSATLDDMQATLTAVVRRAELAESANISLTSERNAAQKRAAQLERQLARSGTSCDELRAAAAAAQQAQQDVEARMREMSEIMADAQGRLAALQHTVSEDTVRIATLEANLGAERDARIAAETECDQLREELSRRPPIDVLRQLDIDSLLHRNLEAAAAMQSLLAIAQASRGSASPAFPPAPISVLRPGTGRAAGSVRSSGAESVASLAPEEKSGL